MSETAQTGKTAQSERALRDLRTRILSGEMKPDQHVTETAVASLLGISRTPTREALARLVEEGLLERTSSGRCSVRPFSRADISDAIELRGVLEGTVVRLAAERGACPRQMALCRRILDQIDTALPADVTAIAFDSYGEHNAAFHDALATLSGSATFERELHRACRLPLAAPSAFLQSQTDVPEVRRSLYVAQAQHRAILDAIDGREGARAEALAREHARLALRNFDHVLNQPAHKAAHIPGLALVTEPTGNPTP